jgi:conjugal transfer/entry exclusion protein
MRGSLSRSAALLGLATTCFCWTGVAPAQFAVVDVANIAQIGKQITEGLAQLQATENQVNALRNAARQLDPSNYRGIEGLLTGQDLNVNAILGDVRTIGFTLDRVNSQFAQIFPNQQAVQNMRATDFDSTTQNMHQELYNSAIVAARAQSSLESIEASDTEAKAILERSQGTDSQVAQLESAIQMLALIHQNLVAITMSVNAAGRLASDVTAQAVVGRRVEREKRARLLDGYANHDDAIPDIDSNFLHPR